MAFDRKLLEILVCPQTHQPLSLRTGAQLDALNQAIDAGQIKRNDGSAQTQPISEALLSNDGAQLYRIDDGIPVLLAEEAIAMAQLTP